MGKKKISFRNCYKFSATIKKMEVKAGEVRKKYTVINPIHH